MANEQKTPLARTLSLFGQKKALDEIAKLGYALPGHVVTVSGAIVTINFDVTGVTLPQVTMPIYGAEYFRLPIQVGDLGVAFPASISISGVSGLGNGEADSTQQGNLSALVWFPVGNKNWTTVDPNAVTIYGPNGVVFRDEASGTVATLTPTGLVITSGGTISFMVGAHAVTITPAGITIDGDPFAAHTHSGVATGSGVTGPVVPGS